MWELINYEFTELRSFKKSLMTTIKHSEPFEVRSHEVDSTGTVSLPRIADYFQEAAGKNARDLNFDISDLQEKGTTWVLFRLHIRMDSFPERWQDITVNTWPSSGDGVRAFRDYELVNSDGDRLGVGVSQWMVLNMKSRRPVRMPKEITEMGLDVDKHLLPVDKDSFDKLADPDSVIISTHQAGKYDMDMNNHVNNVKYIEWMTGFLPEKITKKKKCFEINIQFHRETSLGSKVTVKSEPFDDESILHNIIDQNNQLLAEGVSRWKALDS